MSDTETISATEFKAKCLNILDRLASHQLQRVVITKHGRPVGVITPPDVPQVTNLFGCMRGSVIIADDFDLTEPVMQQPFTAEQGLLHG